MVVFVCLLQQFRLISIPQGGFAHRVGFSTLDGGIGHVIKSSVKLGFELGSQRLISDRLNFRGISTSYVI